MSTIRVKFLIDKEEKRVVFAEAGSDFIDVLFSFLTLPLGSIVRLLDKQSGLGSLDSLYESVEQLDVEYMQTEACKEMLLNPRSAAAIICEDLKIKNIHESNPRNIYYCNERECLVKSCYYTYVKKCRCTYCHKLMAENWLVPKNTSDEGGIFVNKKINFLITNNLRVIPISLMEGCSLLRELRIKDASILEERVIDFGTTEVLNLLKRALASKNPLTEVCYPDVCMQATVNCPLPIKEDMDVNKEEGEIALKLVLNKKTNNVLYAEVGEHFLNQLLSFLTFPLGSVLRLISDNSSALGGCINNLYSSVENMCLDYFKSENCKNMLLSPKLATFYGFEKQILTLEEIEMSVSFQRCYLDNVLKPCKHSYCSKGLVQTKFIEQNPKSGKVVTDIGGVFVVESTKLMVADNLHISLLSIISAIKNDINLPIFDLVEKNVCLDKAKALMLLSTMLISKTVFTDVFLS